MRSGTLSQLRSILLATFVAVLIWLFAEGESLSTRTKSVTVEFPTDPAGDVIIRTEDPNWRGTASVRVEGTARSIDDAVQQIKPVLRLAAGTPGLPNSAGEQKTVDLLQAINAAYPLRNVGSSIVEVYPQYVTVQVVRMASKDLPVHVDMPAELPLDGQPVVTPATVKVRGSEGALKLLGDTAAATGTISDAELRKIKGEGQQTLRATVHAPMLPGGAEAANEEPLVVTPDTVNVTVRVRRQVETFKPASVPVWYSLPPTEDGSKWSVEIVDKFLPDVALVGPADDIKRVRAGEIPVKAMVELTTDELEKGITSKAATFPGLPSTITVNAANPQVRLKITRRDGTTPGAPAPAPAAPAPTIPPPRH